MIHKLLGIKYPILQGAMAHIATARFAAHVSNCGGLGIIGTGGWDAEQVERAILECKQLTERPFGVNLMLMNPHTEAIVDVVCKHHVDVVTTGAGNPGIYVERLRAAGIKIIPVVASVALARRLEPMVDAFVVEGCEAGGHVGESTTMALLPQVVAAVRKPVIAAGGIASGEQMAAALMLGAQGVQVGTMLLVSEECEIHENYKAALIKAKDNDTVVTGRSVGAPVRIIKNQMSRNYTLLEQQGATLAELEHLTLGSLRRSVFEGDVKHGSLMAGQVCGMLKEIKPMQIILDDLMADTRACLRLSSAIEEAL
ncbi:MAG: nitronate monooxygenase [Erysipelotrichaceae bacterium]